MGRSKRVHEDTYEEDAFVENDDGNAPPNPKKAKKAAPGKSGQKTVEKKSWEVGPHQLSLVYTWH